MNARIISTALFAALMLEAPAFAQIGNNPTRSTGGNPTVPVGRNPNNSSMPNSNNFPQSAPLGNATPKGPVTNPNGTITNPNGTTSPGIINGNPNGTGTTSAAGTTIVGNGTTTTGTTGTGTTGTGSNGTGTTGTDTSALNGLGFTDTGSGAVSSNGGSLYPFPPTADNTRANGQYMKDVAIGENYDQMARTKMIENDKLYTGTYFDRRRVHDQNVALERGPRASPEELSKIAKDAAPKRLTAYQLNPISGTINWPATFQNPMFSNQRALMDKLFASRDATTGLGSELQKTIMTVAGQMQAVLRDHISDVAPAEYVSARKFLDSLAYESQFIPGVAVDGVATAQ